MPATSTAYSAKVYTPSTSVTVSGDVMTWNSVEAPADADDSPAAVAFWAFAPAAAMAKGEARPLMAASSLLHSSEDEDHKTCPVNAQVARVVKCSDAQMLRCLWWALLWPRSSLPGSQAAEAAAGKGLRGVARQPRPLLDEGAAGEARRRQRRQPSQHAASRQRTISAACWYNCEAELGLCGIAMMSQHASPHVRACGCCASNPNQSVKQ